VAGGTILSDFAEFAYEPRGGYGDGHQTALAFAVAARRGGAGCARTVAWPPSSGRGRVHGVRLHDGSRIGPVRSSWRPGRGPSDLAAAVGVDLPVRAQRAQILLVDPGQ
jgi:sarcosine oxidase subunit beta